MPGRHDDDPELLPPPEMIRHAEQLIRGDHRVSDPDWKFWQAIADYLNNASHIPDRTGNHERDWREFNRAQDIAIGYLRMHARNATDAAATTAGEEA